MGRIISKYGTVMMSGLLLIFSVLFVCRDSYAQSYPSAVQKAEALVSKQSLKETIAGLTSRSLLGRESGTEGCRQARDVVYEAFVDGKIPMKGQTYLWGFWYWKGNERTLGVNVVGFIPADPSVRSPKTLVIGANYDGMGVLGGRVYPGADNNASGAAALIEVGKALSHMASEGFQPRCNICLVAFDARQLGYLGSSRFLSDAAVIKASEVSLMINLDQIGTTLAPPKEAQTGELLPRNYLLFLGMDGVGENIKEAFKQANGADNPIVLDFTCYGNKHVHDMLYEMGDQVSFRDSGIPAIVITSGVHKYTNKTADDIGIINFNALTERCRLIFRAVCKIAGMTE